MKMKWVWWFMGVVAVLGVAAITHSRNAEAGKEKEAVLTATKKQVSDCESLYPNNDRCVEKTANGVPGVVRYVYQEQTGQCLMLFLDDAKEKVNFAVSVPCKKKGKASTAGVDGDLFPF